MRSIAEIEHAIEQLPVLQMDELAEWLAALRAKRTPSTPAEDWLQHARGAAQSGMTTAQIMSLTRDGE